MTFFKQKMREKLGDVYTERSTGQIDSVCLKVVFRKLRKLCFKLKI
jgi:hypothetical protein